MRVLQVAYPFAPVALDTVGGAEAVLAHLDDGLTARGIESVVVACQGSSVRGRLRAVPREVGPFDDATRARAHARHRTAIRAALETEPFDLVHLHGVDFADYLPDNDVPCVVTLHLPLDHYPATALREAGSRVRFVCVSRDELQRGGDVLRLPIVVENGVPVAPAEAVERAGFVLCLGRICPEKGFEVALDAARAADLPLVLAGRVYPYAEHERYFDQEIRPRLDARRRFVGPVAGRTKRRLLASAACVAIPSRVAETSSLVAMEAAAAGTPVVARPVGALGSIIEDGVTGLFADDVAGFAAAFQAATRLDGDRCRAHARARFDVDRMVDRYLRLYRALAARAAA